jgi:hypothetical protein
MLTAKPIHARAGIRSPRIIAAKTAVKTGTVLTKLAIPAETRVSAVFSSSAHSVKSTSWMSLHSLGQKYS